MRSKVFLMLRAAVSLALIAVLTYTTRDSIPKMFEALKRLPLYVFFLGLLMLFASLVTASLRMRILLAAQGILLTVPNILKLTFLGYFFSSFLPTSVGGDVVKAFYISKISNKTIPSYASVFMDRFLGMCSIFLLATAVFFYAGGLPHPHLKWLLPLLLAASVLLLVFLFNRQAAERLSFLLRPALPARFKKKLKNVYDTLNSYKNYKREVAECLFISMFGQAIAFSAVYVFAFGLSSYVPLKFVLLAMLVAAIAGLIPSLYGTGPREMAIVIILSPFIGKERALAVALLWLAMLLITALVGGLAYMATGLYKIKPVELSQA